MTLLEASKRLCVKIEVLRRYEENGLLKGRKSENGTTDYTEADLQHASHLYFLQKSGMDLENVKRFAALLENGGKNTRAEQIRILKKCRYKLLDEIHGKQQSLDHLDYLIYEIKNKES